MTSIADVRDYAEVSSTQQAVQGQETSPRQFTPVEVIRLAIMWRVWAQALGL